MTASPPSQPSKRTPFCTILFSILLVIVFIALPLYFHLTPYIITYSLPISNRKGLKFLTLIFNQTYDHPTIEHNCAVISPTHHTLTIYTDDINRSYCAVCKCIKFELSGCQCPKPSKRECLLCEKLHFVKNRLIEFGQFAFMDSDLAILHPSFMDALERRTNDFDFLAAYGFGDMCDRKYLSMFNSGLFFMRKVAGVDYEQLEKVMWDIDSNNDQNALSVFVFRMYHRWDSLSLKWHCRFLAKRGYGIRKEDCFTLHGRGTEIKDILKGLNKTLLTLPAGK